MTIRRLLIPGILAIIGYGTLALLFPRLDPSARWGMTDSRQQAVTKAREVALTHGIETTGWKTYITTRRDRNAERWLATKPASPFTARLSPLTTDVVMGNGKQAMRISFANDGRLRSFKYHDPENKAPASSSPENIKQTAAAALKELVGDDNAQFALLSEADQANEGRRFTWEAAKPEAGPLKFTVEALVQGQLVKELTLKPVYPPSLIEEVAQENKQAEVILAAITFTTMACGLLVALIFYFFGVARRSVAHRVTLVFTLIALSILAINAWLGGALEIQRSEAIDPTINLPLPGNALLSFIVSQLLAVLLVVIFEGGSQAISTRNPSSRMKTFVALLRGKIFARPVATHLAAGLLCGGLIAVLPYLLVVSRLAGQLQTDNTASHRLFSSLAPGLVALTPRGVTSLTFSLFIVFGFMVPLTSTYLRSPLLGRIAGFIIGVLIMTDTDYFTGSHVIAALIVGIITMLIGDQLARRFDLLAVVAAGFAAEVIRPPMALLMQPASSLKMSGLLALLTLGAVLVAALVVAWKGSEQATIEETALIPAAGQVVDQAERERLKAEFGVARRAQQQMLPDSVPDFPGFEIAGICRPSREVGGDLYDYIPMSDGRLGIVVADVSGKGVPASLYMTLTKGLMLSAAQDRTDPGEILCEVNKHLYEVCRRKMFVTLFFGIIDPQKRTMTYSRAGHNPPVWRSISAQSTRLLRPAGPGLGLTSSKAFDRVLKVEEIQLDSHDALFIYSDGITEAMNHINEEYGEERLMAAAERADGLGADEALNAVLGDVSAFLAGNPPQDDQTLVVVRVGAN